MWTSTTASTKNPNVTLLVKGDPGEIIDTESFSNACKLLGLNTAKLEKAMLFRSRTILKEVTMNP